MPSKIKGEKKTDTSHSQPQPDNIEFVTVEQCTSNHKTSEERAYESSKIEHTTEPRSFVGWSLFFDALLVLATCTSVGIATYQWKAMKNQSQIMEKQTIAAFQQLSTAKVSIRIATDTLKDARKSGIEQSDRAERLTKANEKIAQASKQSIEHSKASLESSTRQAQTALDASREAANLDQRAWVGLVNVETQGGVQTREDFSFKSINVAIRNSGKTPALKLSGECCMFVNRPWTDRIIPDYDTETKRAEEERRKRNEDMVSKHPEMAERIKEFDLAYSSATTSALHTGGVLAPGIISNISVAPSMKLGRRNSDEPPSTLYILGKFTYNDIFTGTLRHSTKFCLMYIGGNSYTICPESNWMD